MTFDKMQLCHLQSRWGYNHWLLLVRRNKFDHALGTRVRALPSSFVDTRYFFALCILRAVHVLLIIVIYLHGKYVAESFGFNDVRSLLEVAPNQSERLLAHWLTAQRRLLMFQVLSLIGHVVSFYMSSSQSDLVNKISYFTYCS
jgi:hypothetical protein